MSHCCNSVFSRHKWSKFLTNCCPGFFPLTWLRCKWPQHIINKKTVTGPTSCVIKSTCCTICDARECLHVCSPYVRWYPHILSLSVYLLSHTHSHTHTWMCCMTAHWTVSVSLNEDLWRFASSCWVYWTPRSNFGKTLCSCLFLVLVLKEAKAFVKTDKDEH